MGSYIPYVLFGGTMYPYIRYVRFVHIYPDLYPHLILKNIPLFTSYTHKSDISYIRVKSREFLAKTD